MFECPKCGYRDEPCWRASRFMLYTITCKIDELEFQNHRLAEKLKESNGRYEEGPYVYRLAKSGRCYRVLKELEGEYKRGHWTEKPKDPFQKKLLEKEPSRKS